jgi:hypothetical protein
VLNQLSVAQSQGPSPDGTRNLAVRGTLSRSTELQLKHTAARIVDSGRAWEVDWRASLILYFYAVLDAVVPQISTTEPVISPSPAGQPAANQGDILPFELVFPAMDAFILKEFVDARSGGVGEVPGALQAEIEAALKSEAYRSASVDTKRQIIEDKIRSKLKTSLYYPIQNGGLINQRTRITYINEVLKRITSFNDSPNRLKSDAELHRVLKIAEDAWKATGFNTELRTELDRLTVIVINSTEWKPADIPVLKQYSEVLRVNDSYQGAQLVESKIHDLEGKEPWYRSVGKVWIIHILFWLLLIFAYPKFPQIQAIFFWNPWIRRLTGLGYIGFALTWIPFLRSKLFTPFKESLQSDAALEALSEQSYFEQSRVENKLTGDIEPISQAIPEVKGQIVLEGESGLGKSMFLRRLVKRSNRVAVYLPAEKCSGGVIEAIQAKLHGLAQDAKFLRNLIYSGALDICIDGLNEVTSDTRAKIVNFAESYFKGNIMMATQPLEWRPPATADLYIIQPLAVNEMEEFLLFCEQGLAEDVAVSGKDYQRACKYYLEETINERQPGELLSAAKRVLSNPMDLSVVAGILARGEKPNLFRLLEQQFKIMASDYERVNVGNEFPLGKFSERVYRMKLDNESALPAQDCFLELECMRRHKMVVKRQSMDSHSEPVVEWHFRHDKVMEFFIVQTFLGIENKRPSEHLGDPRFRGVYFLLAMLMPLEEAEALREHLLQYAADTKDHTVSDTFIQLLRSRQAASLFDYQNKLA